MVIIFPYKLDDLLGVSIEVRVILSLSCSSHLVSTLYFLLVEELNVVRIDCVWIDPIDLIHCL